MNWNEQTGNEQKNKEDAEGEKQKEQKQDTNVVECASCHNRVEASTIQGGICAPCRVERGRS